MTWEDQIAQGPWQGIDADLEREVRGMYEAGKAEVAAIPGRVRDYVTEKVKATQEICDGAPVGLTKKACNFLEYVTPAFEFRAPLELKEAPTRHLVLGGVPVEFSVKGEAKIIVKRKKSLLKEVVTLSKDSLKVEAKASLGSVKVTGSAAASIASGLDLALGSSVGIGDYAFGQGTSIGTSGVGRSTDIETPIASGSTELSIALKTVKIRVQIDVKLPNNKIDSGEWTGELSTVLEGEITIRNRDIVQAAQRVLTALADDLALVAILAGFVVVGLIVSPLVVGSSPILVTGTAAAGVFIITFSTQQPDST